MTKYLKTAHHHINSSWLVCIHCDENIAHSTLINSDTNSFEITDQARTVNLSVQTFIQT
jgi:hypothetical protein